MTDNVFENNSTQLPTQYQNFIAVSRYARYNDATDSRETWDQTVDRYTDFICSQVEKYNGYTVPAKLKARIRENILNLKVMPSMRALMTAGPALERDNLCSYNCSFIPVNSARSFDEALYVLMNGTGLGFSVESKYVSQLPPVNEHFEKTSTTVVVEDSKAGWARALREIIALLWQGQIPDYDVSKVRPAGARLRTFGGRASGPEPLIDLFHFITKTFKGAAGRQLTPLECHDMMCKIGEVVVVGGVRRSALISLSDLSDREMAKCKSGAWWKEHPHRRLANNSAVYDQKPSVGVFLEEWTALYDSKSGERGVYNRENARRSARKTGRRNPDLVQGLNPCAEINLREFGLCNLSEVIVEPGDTLDDLKEKIEVATILGTFQSTLTRFKYLRKIWKDNAEDERLLGVSLTGQMGHKVLSGQEGLDQLAQWLDSMKAVAVETNKTFAGKLGIKPSASITTVKPSGTVSQLTNSASGMHPWYSEFYIRSVRADNKDPMTQFMKDHGIPNEPDIYAADTTTVFSFPIAAPEGALTSADLTAVQHLDVWLTYKRFWTEHNPSITVQVAEDEWVAVADWVYKNFDDVGGVSFLPHEGSHTYDQAPYKRCSEEEYKAVLAKMPEDIRWKDLAFYETGDQTTGSQTLACTSGSCDVVDLIDNVKDDVLL
jgi:ribonucleoside-triphosphate reductase (thioredoxin)